MEKDIITEALRKSKDLRLPHWGPYSKHYGGISKIFNDPLYSMMDFTFIIGYIRGKVIIPDVNFDSGYYHWKAIEDLSYFSYRYELQWKDIEYADTEFFETENGRLSKVTFVNNSDFDREYVCSVFSTMRSRSHVEMKLNTDEKWIGAENYSSIVYGNPEKEWIDGENYEILCAQNKLSMGKDGLKRGITLQDYLVDNRGLGNQLQVSMQNQIKVADNKAYLMNKGTVLKYSINYEDISLKNIYLRYVMYGIKRLVIEVIIGKITNTLVLDKASYNKGTNFSDLNMKKISCSEINNIKCIEIKVIDVEYTDEDRAFILDGILLSTEEVTENVYKKFQFINELPRFEIIRSNNQKGVGLKSNILKNMCALLYSDSERAVPPLPYNDCTITSVYNKDLSGSDILRKLNNDSLTNWYKQNCIINGDGLNDFEGYNISPVTCKAHSKSEIYISMVCEVNLNYEKAYDIAKNIYDERYKIEKKVRKKYEKEKWKFEATEYAFSQEKLMTQLFTNLTYPIYIENSFYKTYTPGKRWGSLFTWDSGMHGIGLAEYSLEHATEIVNQYMIDDDNEDIDMVLHGSPLPLHIYLLNEIYQKSGDKELLKYFYKRTKKYYNYLSGKSQYSAYDMSKTGLLNPYADGYNSFGIDDYPPQHYCGSKGYYGRVTPVSNTAHMIRVGKIMQIFAEELGFEKDVEEYEEWNNYLSKALNNYSWDQKSGYYSYVFTDTLEKLYYDENTNYNMGLDGVSPIVAGICNEEQKSALINHIMTEGEMWTKYGITSVATNAPYARFDGYWNGKVWIPHQWFIWKAMIGMGELEYADKIVSTALKCWKDTTDDTYNTYEVFDVRTGMGEGCHQFAGLSGPVAAFYNSHYRAGEITVGFDTIIHERRIDCNTGSYEYIISTPFYKGNTGIIIALKNSGEYIVNVGEDIVNTSTTKQWLNLKLKSDGNRTKITVREKR